jgi:hypothetical protein
MGLGKTRGVLVTSTNESELLNHEDFAQAKNWKKSRVEKAIHTFQTSFDAFSIEQQPVRIVNRTYASNVLTRLVRESLTTNNMTDAERVTERKRRSRRAAESGLLAPKVKGKWPSAIVNLQCELLHWLRYGDGNAFRKKAVLSLEKASLTLAEWLMELEIEHVDSTLDPTIKSEQAIFEDRRERLAARLVDNYKAWDPKQLSGLPRGWTIFSGRPKSQAMVSFEKGKPVTKTPNGKN